MTRFVRAIPKPIPASDEVVNYEVALPEISPMLLRLANLIFMLPREADASRKQMFLPTLAIDAKSRKWFGNCKVIISMYIETLRASMDIKRHFLISSSKLVPYLPANSMPPS